MDRMNVGKRKIVIIGVGNVGASIAYALSMKELPREVVLIDAREEVAKCEALDIRHGIAYMGNINMYAGSYEDCKDCDLIIITAGRNRRPGESRLDLAECNLSIIKGIANKLKPYYTNSVIMIVTNPVDIITHKMIEWMDLEDGRIFGTGCILDSSRFISCVADYVGLNIDVISGFVAGEHGDYQIPIWSRLYIAGSPIAEYCKAVGLPWGKVQQDMIAKKVKALGAEIIAGKGSTHYGIATCVCYLADAILNRRSTVACISSRLKGEYGIEDVTMSIPSIVGAYGVERRLVEKWDKAERTNLENTAGYLRGVLDSMD